MSIDIEEFNVRIKEIVKATDTLSKYCNVDILFPSSDNKIRYKGHQDIDYYIGAYLREWYKNNPYVNIEIKEC